MIDLHCHTSISDNSDSIETVLDQAKHNGVDFLAITDHDTTSGIARAVSYGKKIGVTVIPGIEISGYDYARDRRAHLLGLFIDPEHPAIETLCRPMREERAQASKEMVDRLITLGYSITWEEVAAHAADSTNVYKQHIMHTLIDKGYTDAIYGDLYHQLFARGQGSAYVPVHYLDARDAIQTIRAAGGVPILAHPGQFDNFTAVPEWVRAGLEGIEVYHPLHDSLAEQQAMQLAEKHGLVISGGSDYHGFYSDTGSSIGDKGIDRHAYEAIKFRKQLIARSR
ncbi:PHP domain-containing protein [Sporolactobacillus sp. CPB3-1]|uniref:PHP domain-containing protein n=1 Tax=Sporolactobacillus mangiferae TaxID=2940498 RepID=A0ABT0MBY6_9BACL|nr:PHP domain-containing protein [Sporolactobacillus mangiferae]MCL1632168.1 PHP domain-containing protein [Sporolactobacillus mangiferae]